MSPFGTLATKSEGVHRETEILKRENIYMQVKHDRRGDERIPLLTTFSSSIIV